MEDKFQGGGVGTGSNKVGRKCVGHRSFKGLGFLKKGRRKKEIGSKEDSCLPSKP